MIHSKQDRFRTPGAPTRADDFLGSPLRSRVFQAACLLAILAQTLLPFAHVAFEAEGCLAEIAASGTPTVEAGSEIPDAVSHHASCSLCQFLSASRHVTVPVSVPPRLRLEAQDVPRSDRACVAACRVDVRTAGPRGPPRAA